MAANYSQYCMFDKYSGTKFASGALHVEPTFPMHCSRRVRWFFSKFTADRWEFLSRADVLMMRVLNVKTRLGAAE